MRIVVDTKPPEITLRELPRRDGEVGVAWEIRDDNLDTITDDALRLEYRQAGEEKWQTLTPTAKATEHRWKAAGDVEVRLQARDLAGNWGEATIMLTTE
jgi:hypothetical protein